MIMNILLGKRQSIWFVYTGPIYIFGLVIVTFMSTVFAIIISVSIVIVLNIIFMSIVFVIIPYMSIVPAII